MQEKQLIDEIVTELYKRLANENLKAQKIFIVGQLDEAQQSTLAASYRVVTEVQDAYSCDVVFIASMSVELLTHIALGCAINDIEQIILRSLLQGKQVYVLQDGIELYQYKESSYKNLYSMYQSYLDQIELNGIQIISDGAALLHLDEMKRMDRNQRVKLPTYETSFDMTSKKLLLEKDLMDARVKTSARIQIKRSCIITPLAEDYIRKHMIVIERL